MLLETLRQMVGDPENEDNILEFCLDTARDIICDRRHSDRVEEKYINSQISIAIYLYNKRGAEGQTSHSENGISRGYEVADIPPSLLRRITPVVRTPWSEERVII